MRCNYYNMLKKPLIETNPYLRVPEKYRSSSTAVETGATVKSVERSLTQNGKTGQFKK